jgi:hypothetical protein
MQSQRTVDGDNAEQSQLLKVAWDNVMGQMLPNYWFA